MRSMFMHKIIWTYSATNSHAIFNKYHEPICSVSKDNCVSVYTLYFIKISIY